MSNRPTSTTTSDGSWKIRRGSDVDPLIDAVTVERLYRRALYAGFSDEGFDRFCRSIIPGFVYASRLTLGEYSKITARMTMTQEDVHRFNEGGRDGR